MTSSRYAARVCDTSCRSTLSDIRKAQNGASLAIHPLVDSASQARGYVNKGRRFLSDVPVGQFSEYLAHHLQKIRGAIFLQFPLELSYENNHSSRSLAQLILAALSLYPLEVKEGPARRFLSDVSLCRFSLAMYPSVRFADSGPKWPFWAVLGLALASWSFCCLLYTSPSPRDATLSRMPSSA